MSNVVRWRRETILDVYNLALGAFLFVAPWLFSYAYEPAKADDWVSSAIVVASSTAALLAFAEWEEWIGIVVGLWVLGSLAARLPAHQGDAGQRRGRAADHVHKRT
jgi:hypothetical protein